MKTLVEGVASFLFGFYDGDVLAHFFLGHGAAEELAQVSFEKSIQMEVLALGVFFEKAFLRLRLFTHVVIFDEGEGTVDGG